MDGKYLQERNDWQLPLARLQAARVGPQTHTDEHIILTGELYQ